MKRPDLIIAVSTISNDVDTSPEACGLIHNMHHKIQGAYSFLFELEDAAEKKKGEPLGVMCADLAKMLRAKLEA
jgi:hypothetical protein